MYLFSCLPTSATTSVRLTNLPDPVHHKHSGLCRVTQPLHICTAFGILFCSHSVLAQSSIFVHSGCQHPLISQIQPQLLGHGRIGRCCTVGICRSSAACVGGILSIVFLFCELVTSCRIDVTAVNSTVIHKNDEPFQCFEVFGQYLMWGVT